MYHEMVGRISTGLNLYHVPIGISFLKDAPKGVKRLSRVVPSACTFWRMAEKEMFYASAEDHDQCPIGTMTMGFQLAPEKKGEADELFEQMLKLEYLSPNEFSSIPMMEQGHQFVLYGPLIQYQSKPDVCLMILRPGQAMLLSEGLGSADWGGPGINLLGRPTCASIPQALLKDKAVTSTACIGARIFAELSDEELIAVIPGSVLNEKLERILANMKANRSLSNLFEKKKEEISRIQP